MKYTYLLFFLFVFLLGCENSINNASLLVSNKQELEDAANNAQPGDHIVLKNGTWKDVEILLNVSGTENKPITLRGESPGEVVIEGQSDLKLGGDYIIVRDLYFTNGHSPSRAVISFGLDDEQVANHCIVSNCVIEDFNKPQRNNQDLWVQFYGRHNQLDHCYIAGKSNRGPTIRVDLRGNKNIKNYHKITNNHFGPRPPKGGPSAETIQIGNSFTSMCPSYTEVSNNLFDRCNGEVEVISSKTNFNEFRNNVFYKSEGSLVTRHGNYCTVDGNYFIGDEASENIGGIRLIGTGHWVTNNYFYKLKGQNFRSPLAVMNGIPKSPLNRYIQVTDVVVAHNTWVDCLSPLQFGVGSNVSQKDVLPASEIRSAIPIRTTVANNVIYNKTGDPNPIVAHDKLDGILFKSNVINNKGEEYKSVPGLEQQSFDVSEIGPGLVIPTDDFSEVEVYRGFEFDQIATDLFGAKRQDKNSIGATIGKPTVVPSILDRANYGPSWFNGVHELQEGAIHAASTTADLVNKLSAAGEGDVIELSAGNYEINNSLAINKRLTIRGPEEDGKATILFKGEANSPLFEMNPKGELTLQHITLRGESKQHAFASLKVNMSSLYNLSVDNCKISNFDFVLKGYKYSFAEHINFSSSTIKNCKNGIELSEETEDKGEYNAENITIKDCVFENIGQNVIDYYRGGYDESTVGGSLNVINSTFKNCGGKEKNRVLLNTYGIINVNISGNQFIDNQVKLVALLWGAKNNQHSENTIKNSGQILVEENLKLNLLY